MTLSHMNGNAYIFFSFQLNYTIKDNVASFITANGSFCYTLTVLMPTVFPLLLFSLFRPDGLMFQMGDVMRGYGDVALLMVTLCT
jgi:hypothetical protein